MAIDIDKAYPQAEAARRGALNDLGNLLRDLIDSISWSGRLVNLAAATLTLKAATHDNKTITVNRAAGSTLTLPVATGSGARFRVFVGTTITSNNLVIQAGDASDEMLGSLVDVDTDSSDAIVGFAALDGDGFDTITLNGSTKGGLKGDHIELEDVATNNWAVRGLIHSTGLPATPFSSDVI